MWNASVTDGHGSISKFHNLPPDLNLCIYICGSSSIPRLFDPLNYLLQHGCYHLVKKILNFLDSTSLLSASLVSTQWQQLIFEWYYICQKSRQSINKKLYQKGPVKESFIHFELKKTLAKIVDVHLDADLNLFCLTLLAGTPHVLISSLFSQGRSRVIHRFQDYLEPVTCISSGNTLVAIGSKFGKIYVYQSIITQSGSVHITAILAHHAATVHKILFYKDQIISCSDDMTVGIISLLPDGALVLSKILKVSSDKIREIQTSSSPSIDKLG